jgi:hypothetical protein
MGEVARYALILWRPLSILTVVLVYLLARSAGVLPTAKALSDGLGVYFDRYGLGLLAFVCFIEYFAPINTWFPGAFGILSAMASTSGDPSKALIVFLVIWISSFVGLAASYLFGGFFLRNHYRTGNEPASHSLLQGILFIHPQMASLHLLQLGAERQFSLQLMVQTIGYQSAWSLFWGGTIYWFGVWFLESSAIYLAVFAYLLLWLARDVRRYRKSID